ncbi:MAG: TonB-dependent receptor plug domain-containing protein [Chlorobi bacterium]|nr:TonB-dependent receptor plug domain-containing protein [Chlorobiota bacterium]
MDFALNPTEFETEEIVVVSRAPLIRKSATNAIRVVNAEDINALPMRNISDIVALQPGIVKLNGVTYIRGSRADETGYLVEGADVKNILSRNGGSLVTVTPDALQEITTQAGGYTAEYGNANAGIISQEFKTGSEDYRVSLRMETDNFGNYSGANKFLGSYSYGYSDNVITFSGPVITKKLKLFISGENRFMRDRNPHYFSGNPYAYSDGALFDTTRVYDTGIYGGNTSDSEILSWNSGAIPQRFSNRYTVNGTLLWDSNPLFIRLAGSYSINQNQNNGASIRNMFNLGRIGLSDASNILLNLKGTYLLSEKTFIVGNINYFDSRSKRYDPLFVDNYMSYSDSLAASEYGYQYRNYTTGPATYDFYGFPFAREGQLATGYGKTHNNYIGGSLSYTTQWNKNAIKIGGSYQRWTVRSYSLGGAQNILSTIRSNPDMASNSDSLAYLIGNQLYRSWDNYGYDVFGNEINDGVFEPKHPVLASAYIQDRVEYKDLIINFGLRFDHIDMDSWAWTNPKLPVVDDNTHLIPDSAMVKGRTFDYLSPRLGFSFPVTDRTVFHVQYGKFVQSPSLDIAYRGIYSAAEILAAANLFTNPVAYDPEPIRTTQYEVGFTQQFTDFAALDITAFYKDIKGQMQYANIYTEAGAARSKYATFINQDFATTTGFEFSLKIRRIHRIRAQVDYTYSNSQGTNTFSSSGVGSLETNNQVPTVLMPLTFDYTHVGSMMLDYRFGKDDGGPVLEQLGLNLLFTFNSGHPFTYAQDLGLAQSSAWTGGLIPATDTRGRRPIGPVNSSTTPWQYNIDLRIDKTVNIFNFDVNFYVYVRNLLNTKNVINVYQKTGNAYDDGFLNSSDGQQIIAGERYTERFADLYRALNLENRQHAYSVYGYDLFGSPRQLRAGIVINF